MHRCLLFLGLLVALLSMHITARADDLPNVQRYAAVLREFDPRLSAGEAEGLAIRTIGEATALRIDARLVVALVATESAWDARAISPVGARGLGQLMPATALALRVDPDDEQANLDGTIRELALLLRRYAAFPVQARFERTIAAYNAGPGAVDRYAGIPPYPETQTYVRRVIGLWRQLAGAGA